MTTEMTQLDFGMVADSSGLVSLAVQTDHNHASASALAKDFLATRGSILVPADVLSETLNVLGKKVGKDTAVKVGETLLTGGLFVIVETDEEIWNDAFSKYRQQPASVSFTDCIVMAAADFYGFKYIFGYDGAFKKNGYTTPEQVLQSAA